MTAPFILAAEPAAWWPVSFTTPADGGATVEQRIDLKFVRLGIADFQTLWGSALTDATSIAAGDVPAERAPADIAARNRALFDRCVKGWRNIVDGEGSPVPFAEPWIGRLLDVPGFPQAFGLAYWGFWQARAETALGNFEPSPAGGPATADPAAAAATPDTATRSPRRSGNGARPKRT